MKPPPIPDLIQHLAPRPLILKGPSGPLDGRELVGFTGSEGLDGVSSFDLTVRIHVNAKPPAPGDLVHFGSTGNPRSGIVTLAGRSGDWLRVVVGSPLENLALAENSRTWVDRDLPTILDEILGRHGVARDMKKGLVAGPYQARPLTIQYRETDLAFVSRQMERAGLFFVFDAEGKALLRDTSTVPIAGDVPVLLSRSANPGHRVTAWEDVTTLAPAGLTTLAIGQERPETNWSGRQGKAPEAAGSGRLTFETGSRPEAEARTLALWRAMTCYRSYAVAASDAPLAPGTRVSFESKDYLVVAVSHGASCVEGYRNTFVAIPADVPFHLARVTPRARLDAPMKAVVLGADGTSRPDGSNAHADNLGRVAIRFLWDRPDASPVWARVAPGGFTTLTLPRAGDVVEVEFRDDDATLDHPLVTRRAPWAPEDLPHKTDKKPARSTTIVPSTQRDVGSQADVILAVDQAADQTAVHIQAPGQAHLKVGGATHLILGNDLLLKLAETISLRLASSGKASLSLGHLVVEAKGITFKVGGSTIVLGEGGVTIDGSKIYIKSPGGPKAETLDDGREPIESTF